MKLQSLAVIGLSVLMLNACSSSGRSGTGSPDDYAEGDLGEGNIPTASIGRELPDINFAYDSSSLSEDAKESLKKGAKWLSSNASTKVVVEGHCDERGTSEYNLALGERRAKSANDYLRSLGVSSSQLSTVSYGSEVPLDTGHNESAYARNRRVHFSPKK